MVGVVGIIIEISSLFFFQKPPGYKSVSYDVPFVTANPTLLFAPAHDIKRLGTGKGGLGGQSPPSLGPGIVRVIIHIV